jgi:hypothetical protein
MAVHGAALGGSRTGATESWRCNSNPVNPVNPVGKTSERKALHWAVREPALRNHGGAIPILFILSILSILSEKRPNARRCTERFTNRSYGIMAVPCTNHQLPITNY